MVNETVLFTNEERRPLDRSIIDTVALPVGDVYEDALFTGYFADYGGMARKYAPARIFEVGVRYGYIAIALMLGAQEGRGDDSVLYRGIDDESYHGGSTQQANANFAQVVPWADARALKWNSFDDWPGDLGTFDMIHIDGNHDYGGVWNDLNKAWPRLNAGGILMLDDATTPGIAAAIDNFLGQFANSPETVEFQRQPNERFHVYLRKVP